MNIRLFVVVVAPILLLGGAAIFVKMRSNETPDVQVVGGMLYDAGNVPAKYLLTHAFRLNNPHGFPVGLSIVTTGCECTTAKVSASSIPPHGEAEVTLNVKLEDTKNISSGVCFATTHGDKRVESWLMLSGHVERAANKKP